jgi:hypothetical protein
VVVHELDHRVLLPVQAPGDALVTSIPGSFGDDAVS